MAAIEIYIKSWCPYCHMAKGLLQSKGQAFVEFDVELEPDKYEEMLGRSEGRWTVPEIFVNGRLIGGYTELKLLDLSGQLDQLLGDGD
jgi:glutaredoxin 3